MGPTATIPAGAGPVARRVLAGRAAFRRPRCRLGGRAWRSAGWLTWFIILLLADGELSALAGDAVPAVSPPGKLTYLDTSFENASPAWHDVADDGTIRIHLLYDRERASPNRAAGHIHMRLEAEPGAPLRLEFVNLDNVWNGEPGSIARELRSLVVSEDGRHWRSVATESVPTNRVQLRLSMPGPSLYLARVEPYRLSDLERSLTRWRRDSRVAIEVIGQTVLGRDLEIVRVGKPAAPHRVFLRARAHPWEAGGNWVVEGLVDRLLARDEAAARFRRHYCVYVLPMANKDGVARGGTRFNARGSDLNRQWDRPANAAVAPENAALERWLAKMNAAGERPELAIELHNDGNGQLHLSRPGVPGVELHLARMARFEQLLRQHTWFTEGSTAPTFRNPGSLGDGWLERFGIDAVIHEFNCNWIAGLGDYPSAAHWREYGAQLATVLDEYFNTVPANRVGTGATR